jgi:ABC-type transporter Mla MlaB component
MIVEYQVEEVTKKLGFIIKNDLTSQNLKKIGGIVSSVLKNSSIGKWKDLDFDLRHVRKVDSAGINFLVAIIRDVKDAGGVVSVTIDDVDVRNMFEFSRIVDMMELTDLSEE